MLRAVVIALVVAAKAASAAPANEPRLDPTWLSGLVDACVELTTVDGNRPEADALAGLRPGDAVLTRERLTRLASYLHAGFAIVRGLPHKDRVTAPNGNGAYRADNIMSGYKKPAYQDFESVAIYSGEKVVFVHARYDETPPLSFCEVFSEGWIDFDGAQAIAERFLNDSLVCRRPWWLSELSVTHRCEHRSPDRNVTLEVQILEAVSATDGTEVPPTVYLRIMYEAPEAS